MQYLRALQEAKVETERNMTAYFAHELRNPLGAITGALNAMPDDLPEALRKKPDIRHATVYWCDVFYHE
jgi:nitrogen-specific signal transduction histidine kinase